MNDLEKEFYSLRDAAIRAGKIEPFYARMDEYVCAALTASAPMAEPQEIAHRAVEIAMATCVEVRKRGIA